MAASRMVSALTGIQVQRNKAIVGENAFAHEAGIHQDGVLKERRTYEIMRPEDIGLARSQLVLGKHSGRHALRVRAGELGFKLTDEQLEVMYDRFKALADQKKVVYDEDLEAILEDEFAQVAQLFRIESLHISSGTHATPTASLWLRGPNGEILKGASSGDGPVDAAYRAIQSVTGVTARLKDYRIRSVTTGEDAQGEVSVEVECKGQRVSARAVSTDIIQSSALAYLKAINSALARRKRIAERRTVRGRL
jgi:2-isopropylmalate synthase